METTIPTSEKLIDILNEIPKEVQEMYQIKVDSFMGERYKLYIKSPVWMTLSEEQIERVAVFPTSIEIKCESICIRMHRECKDLQICVY
jgi:hypothetical protein